MCPQVRKIVRKRLDLEHLFRNETRDDVDGEEQCESIRDDRGLYPSHRVFRLVQRHVRQHENHFCHIFHLSVFRISFVRLLHLCGPFFRG